MMCVSLFSYQGSLLFSSDNFDILSCSKPFVKNFFIFSTSFEIFVFALSSDNSITLPYLFQSVKHFFIYFLKFFEDLILWQKIKQAVLLTCFKRRRRDSNPRAAINDLLPFQGSPFGQLGYFSIARTKSLIHLSEAERVGFEPTRPFGQTVFKTASL